MAGVLALRALKAKVRRFGLLFRRVLRTRRTCMSDKSQEDETSRLEGGGQKDQHNRASAFSAFKPSYESNAESVERQVWRAEDLGVPRLDILMGGGVPRGSLALIVGPPGSGKTTLAHQIACAVAGSGRRAITFAALSE